MDRSIITQAPCCHHCKYHVYISNQFQDCCNLGGSYRRDDTQKHYDWCKEHKIHDTDICPFFEWCEVQ
jgi:hypothetical protein